MRYNNKHSIAADKNQVAYEALLRSMKHEAQSAPETTLRDKLTQSRVSATEANIIRTELMRRTGALA